MIDFVFTITRSGGEAVDYSEYVTHPYSLTETLDESLDQAMITLKNTSEEKPFLKCDRAVFSGASRTTREFVVAHDDVKSIYSTGLFEHTLTLVEETKVLETIASGGGKCFTQPLAHDYAEIPDTQATAFWNTTEFYGGTNYPSSTDANASFICADGTYTVAQSLENGLRIYSGHKVRPYFQTMQIFVTKLKARNETEDNIYRIGRIGGGGTAVYDIMLEPTVIDHIDTTVDIPLATIISRKSGERVSGTYRIRYYSTSDDIFDVFIRATIPEEQPPTVTRDDLTVYEAGKRLCETAESILADESPRYTFAQLSSDNLVDYDEIKAPELSIGNNRSLWEAMLELARFVHAVPRLYGSIIKFDRLGSQEYANITELPVAQITSADGERYASSLDCMAQNLVKEDCNLAQLPGTYISVRSESVRINEDSAYIDTDFEIYRVNKLGCKFFKKKSGSIQTTEIDLTPYVYEAHEYKALFSSDGYSYPWSKNMALYYTEGQKGIRGLNYKVENAISPIFEDYSIYNIIETIIGEQVNTEFKTYTPMMDLLFTIEYVPIVTTRIKSPKSETEFHGQEMTIFYNQSAERLDANALSKNLRGTLAMMNSADKQLTYIFTSESELPKAGQKFDDDYYISTVTAEFRNHQYLVATLGLSKKYNALGKYLQLPSQIRQYEISEKNVQDRFIVVEEYAVIGTSETVSKRMLQRQIWLNAFNGSLQTARKGVYVVSTTADTVSTSIASCTFPVVALSIGNSAIFTWKYKDNYSAGTQSLNPENYSAEKLITTGLEEKKIYRITQDVQYGNVYGEAKYLKFSLNTTSGANVSTQSDAIKFGGALPDLTGVTGITFNDFASLAYTPTNIPIKLYKDSRETIHVTYQVNFVTNADIIIGEALAKRSNYISPVADLTAKIYVYETSIDSLNGTTSTVSLNTGGTNLSYNTTNNKTVITPSETLPAHKSWAIINSLGEFVCGANKPFLTNGLYITPRRKV